MRRPGEETPFLLVTPSTAVTTENEPEEIGRAGESAQSRDSWVLRRDGFLSRMGGKALHGCASRSPSARKCRF